MNFVKEARVLVNYIQSLESFSILDVPNKFAYSHMGALFTDLVLQSGLNYAQVVRPRVLRVLNEYPEASTVNSFNNLIKDKGLIEILNWKHPVKINRMVNLVEFSLKNNIDTCIDFKDYLSEKVNHEHFLELNGIGPKTLDYTLKLLSFDTIAVDRHIKSFLKKSGLNISEYQATKHIVEFAADYMNVNRATIDYSIWKFMSSNELKNGQLKLDL